MSQLRRRSSQPLKDLTFGDHRTPPDGWYTTPATSSPAIDYQIVFPFATRSTPAWQHADTHRFTADFTMSMPHVSCFAARMGE